MNRRSSSLVVKVVYVQGNDRCGKKVTIKQKRREENPPKKQCFLWRLKHTFTLKGRRSEWTEFICMRVHVLYTGFKCIKYSTWSGVTVILMGCIIKPRNNCCHHRQWCRLGTYIVQGAWKSPNSGIVVMLARSFFFYSFLWMSVIL